MLAVPLERPYVGLRPFERNEHGIFRGRERDARFLCSKIFSSRLTLLYAPSGVGKSSLLRTLVIPSLEDQRARAFYYDAWAAEDPAEALKSFLAHRAAELGIPDPGAGAPSLRELISLIASFDGQTVVLILDQFEEFLINHPQELDPLRKELAGLVRHSALDVRIVLSLRQEFLAALEPFRTDILNLFHSTYSLDHLDDQGVREAIQEPARLFGVEYEDGLVDTLIRDLRAEQAVDLPMLQLVCGQLWDARGGQSTITRALYESLGGAGRIIDTFVRAVMPQRWQDQHVTAKLMRQLAPASGFKKPYTVDELAENENLQPGRVEQELRRLSARGVLRPRTFRGQELFELQHDAFIRIIAPWRKTILQRAALRRQFRWLLAGIGIAGLCGIGMYVSHYRAEQQELRRNTEGILSELRTPEFAKRPYQERRTLAESRLDYATEYLLLRSAGPERLDTLRDLLKKYEDLQPRGYGIESFTATSGAAAPASDSPIELHFSTLLNVDRQYLSDAWRARAETMAQEWGIPAPERIDVTADPLPMHVLRVTGAKLKLPFDLAIQSNVREKDAIISSARLSGTALEFFHRYKDWNKITELDDGGRWWIVPRWSLPVWKVSGQLAMDASGLPALILGNELRKRPEALLTPEVVDLLLKRVEKRHAGIVYEARAARGERLPQDLIEIVKAGLPLTSLEATLDGLASYPNATSVQAAALVKASLENPQAPLPNLNGAWKTDPTKGDAKKAATVRGRQPSEDVEDPRLRHLPSADYYSIRLFAGRNIQSRFSRPSHSFVERREALAYDFFRKFGVPLPRISYSSSPQDDLLAGGPDAFRIEVLNQTSTDSEAQPIVTTADTAPDRMMAALRFRAEGLRSTLLSQEEVNGLGPDVDDSLKTWLVLKRYSMTDIKVMMRAVLRPSAEELAQRRAAKDSDPIAIPAEDSLRHLDWLLRSLVFWSEIADAHSAAAMTDGLRQTQRARLKPVTAQGNQAVSAQVTRGIAQVEAGSLEEAEKTFAGAVQADRNTAIQAFLAAYPGSLRAIDLRRFTDECTDPMKARLSLTKQVDLEDFLSGYGNDMGQDQSRKLKLCLLASYPTNLHERRLALEKDLMKRHGAAGDWPAAEGGWLALEALEDYQPFADSLETRQSAEAFLKSAISRMNTDEAWKMYQDAEKLLEKPGPKEWSWNILKDLAAVRQDVRTSVELAVQLSNHERAEELQQSLDLAGQLEKRIPASNLSSTDRAWARDWTLFARANALAYLSRVGSGDHWTECEEILRKLGSSPVPGIKGQALTELVEAELDRERYQEAHTMARQAMAVPKDADDPNLYLLDFWANLFLGKYSEARAVAQEALRRADVNPNNDTHSGMLYTAALGKILMHDSDFEETGLKFLETESPYVPYIAMMLYAHLGGQAQDEALQVVRQRWAGADRSRWRERLRGGDESAWREMLIGYYLGEVKSDDIFAGLETEAAYANSDFRSLPMPRRAMLCEAYFYDALLAEAKGDVKARDRRLQQVLETKWNHYLEYKMAKFLLQSGSH